MKRLMNHYHGSYDNLPVGTVLSGRGANYQSQWYDEFYSLVNSLKPEGCLAHHDAVFMTGVGALRSLDEQDDAIQDIDNCGGACDYASRVIPLGKVEAHDMTWLTHAEGLLDRGDTEQAKRYIQNYWSGVMSAEPLVEYLTPSAEVLETDTFESLEGAGLVSSDDRNVFLVSRWQLENDFAPSSAQKGLLEKVEFDRFVVEAKLAMGELSISAGLPMSYENRVIGEPVGDISDVSVSVTNEYIRKLPKLEVHQTSSPEL